MWCRHSLVKAVTGKSVIERAKKGKGFDYWIGDSDEDEMVFSGKARLEVSGIRAGDDAKMASRFRLKCAQVRAGDHLGIPAYIAIIEFGQPKAHLEMK